MPNLPTFRTSQTRTGTRAIPTEAPLPRPTPLPVGAADVGAGAVAEGLSQLGRGIGEVGEALFAIEMEKQRIRDNASLASANGDYDKAIADKIDEARRTDFTSIEQFAAFRKQTEADLDANIQASIGKMSARAGQQFENFTKASRQTSLRQVESALWPKEILFGQSDTLRQYTNKFELLAADPTVSVEDILKDPSLKIIEEGMKPYWRTGEMAKARDRALLGALKKVGRFDDARELAQSSKAFEAEEGLAEVRRISILEDYTKRKTTDLDYDADMKVNDDFVSRIIGKNLLPDEVQNSRLDDKPPRGIFSVDKLSKQEWMQYVSSSFEDPPKKTTPKGFSSASGTVLDYAKFKIPKEAAYRRLLDSRYIHKEIADEDFVWAINHINNPYPRHLVADIEVVTQSNSEAISKGGFLWGLITTDAEEEKARSVNTELIGWIDNEIAKDKEPTREQMYEKSAQLRAQSGREETQSIATPKTKADYDKLPSGTVYIDPETGQLYRKK